MKKMLLPALLMTLAAVCLAGCAVVVPASYQDQVEGSGALKRYEFSVGAVNEIKVELFCDVRYHAAPDQTVVLEIQPNLREYVNVEEVDGVLTVSDARTTTWNKTTPVLTLSMPAPSSLSLAGAGDFQTVDPIVADAFTLNIEGAYTGQADLAVTSLKVSMEGASEFTLTGQADVAALQLNGLGELNALSLQTNVATVNLSGIGTIGVNCQENLWVYTDGLGTVEYKGAPNIHLNNSGLANVKKAD